MSMEPLKPKHSLSTTPTAGQDMATVKANSIKALLDKSKDEIAKALPAHITADRMMRLALTEFRKTPKLMSCNQASFLGAIIQCAQLGLEPGGALGHAYLVPYKDEVQFIIGYRGMMDLARRSGANLIARSVHEKDSFSYEFGLNEKLEHRPSGAADGGKLTHVYAVLTLPNGDKVFDVMTAAEVEAIRDRSQARNSGPWVSDYAAMAKKTVIRRLFKYAPCSVEIQKAVGLDELADAGVSQGNGAIIETTGRSVPQDKAKEIADLINGGATSLPPEPPGEFDAFGQSLGDVK